MNAHSAEKDAPDLMTRLRDEVIAVVAEGLWGGDSDRGHPDYDRIAALYDDAASNVIPSVTRVTHSTGAIVPERKRCICRDICADHCRACNHSGRDLEEPCIADPDWEPDDDDLGRRMAIFRERCRIMPDLLAFHWSPTERRASIEAHGLRPGEDPVTNEQAAEYVSYARTPSVAWALSGQNDDRYTSWDLWVTWLTQPDRGDEIRDTKNRDAWYVATRNKENDMPETITSDLAYVLTESVLNYHTGTATGPDKEHVWCRPECGWVGHDWVQHRAHVAAALVAEGVGGTSSASQYAADYYAALARLSDAHEAQPYEYETDQTYCPASDRPTDQCDVCTILLSIGIGR